LFPLKRPVGLMLNLPAALGKILPDMVEPVFSAEDDLPPVEITVREFEVLERNGNELRVRIACSKGTYIRALARDLGQLLGSGAHLAALRRTRSGSYEIRDAVTLETLEKFLDMTAEKNLPFSVEN